MQVKIKTKGSKGSGIDEWRGILKTAPKVMDNMAEQLAEEAIDLIAECFATQTDPYGKRWQEKAVSDGRSILVGETTRLRRGWSKKRIANGKYVVFPSVIYARAHQDPQPRAQWGGKKLPQRMMIPIDSRGLPPLWQQQFAETLDDVMRVTFASSGAGAGNLGFLAYKIIGLKRRFTLEAIVKRAVKEAADG